MTKDEIRQQASISVLNALLETTQHSVVESVALRDIYAHVAVMYADSLISALDCNPENIEMRLKNWDWKTLLKIYGPFINGVAEEFLEERAKPNE